MSVWPNPSCDADDDTSNRHNVPVPTPSYSAEADSLVGIAASFTHNELAAIHHALPFPPHATMDTSLRLANEVETSAVLGALFDLNTRTDHDRLLIRKVIDLRWTPVHEDAVLGQLLSACGIVQANRRHPESQDA